MRKVFRFLPILIWGLGFALAPGFFEPILAQTPQNKAEAFLETQGNSLRLTLGTGAIRRVIEVGPQGIRTTGIFNRFTNRNYLAATRTEFRLVLSKEPAHQDLTAELAAEDFTFTGYNWIKQDENEQQISFNFEAFFEGQPVKLALYYQARAASGVIRKWLNVAPFRAPLWVIKWVTLEDWQAAPDLEPGGLFPRYNSLYNDCQPRFNLADKEKSVITENPAQRFAPVKAPCDFSREIMVNPGQTEGLFFFQESLFGQEKFTSNNLLGMGNSDYVDPLQGFSSGKAVLGAWQGPPETGYKRYRDYIYQNFAAIRPWPAASS